MVEISTNQLVALGIFLAAICFLGWCFFKYGFDETVIYYKDKEKDDN